MLILSVNAGSSSLKFTLFDMPEGIELISGNFERIGKDNSFYSIKISGEKIKKEIKIEDHGAAVNYLAEELINNGIIKSLSEISGVGHRVVSGGSLYNESTIIDDNFLINFKDLMVFAPLHNPAHLLGINAVKEILPNVINTAVFDTAFHQTMEETEYLYAVPYEWFEKYGIRKYGFHGTSHRFVNKKICEYLNNDKLKVITCHLGNGSSITAINAGRVVDTSMGFSPLSGLIMGTRSGDIDPTIIPFMMKNENKTIDEVFDDLNKKSGLLGISGVSHDSRDIEEASSLGNERCILAEKMCARRVANYIAMYNNLLDEADVICFTAGIGENSPLTRMAIINNLKSLGIILDEKENLNRGKFLKISAANSKKDVYIVPTNEELMIAMDTYELINKGERND